MGRELQKKKRRSKRQPVRPKKQGKVLNPLGNSIIAQAWDKKATLTQNYRRLGLVSRLGGLPGGQESKPGSSAGGVGPRRLAAEFGIQPVVKAVVTEARVERGPDGRIVRVLDRPGANALNDMLPDDEASNDDDAQNTSPLQSKQTSHGGGADSWGRVAELEARAGKASGTVRSLLGLSLSQPGKKPRVPSSGEVAWLSRLVDRHGDDVVAMARDMRLNPMQQTAADIARRIRRLKECAGD